MVKDQLGDDHVSLVSNEQFFVDFLRDIDEQAGDENISEETDFEMPCVYEPIPSWQGLKDRLNFFMSQYNEQVCVTQNLSPDSAYSVPHFIKSEELFFMFCLYL